MNIGINETTIITPIGFNEANKICSGIINI